MTNETIQRILDNHYVPNHMSGDRLMADHMYVLPYGVEMPWVDVTGWGHDQLAAWLGY